MINMINIIYLSIYPSIYPSIHLSIYPSIYLSIYIYIYIFIMYINIYIHYIYIYLIFYRLERICCKHVGSAGSGRIRRPSLSFSNLFLQSLDPAASETRSTSEERMRDLEKQISAKKIQFLGSGCTKCCEASFSFYIYPSGSW